MHPVHAQDGDQLPQPLGGGLQIFIGQLFQPLEEKPLGDPGNFRHRLPSLLDQ